LENALAKGFVMIGKNLLRFLCVAAVAGAALLAPAKPAAAHGHIGVIFGFSPFVFGPPVYYPPPVYYYYPPAYYAPPAYAAPAPAGAAPAGFTCYATPYVCPLNVQQPVGGPCACPAYGGGDIGGTVR
jgi:hypothetical protein